MTGRIIETEPYIGNPKPHEIQRGVSFKPYKGARRFYQTPKGKSPLIIPENYDHGLVLRKWVTLDGMDGLIDVITDQQFAWVGSLLKGGFPLEKPLGETAFIVDMLSDREEVYKEEPAILRVSFHPKTPSNYTKLLNTEAEVKLGAERYMMIWNFSRATARENMQCIEQGHNIWVIEKNLFNIKEAEAVEVEDYDLEELEKLRNEEIGRITFVWLPINLRLLRTIDFRFNSAEHDSESYPVESLPSGERILAGV